jgi:hypothetical protein
MKNIYISSSYMSSKLPTATHHRSQQASDSNELSIITNKINEHVTLFFQTKIRHLRRLKVEEIVKFGHIERIPYGFIVKVLSVLLLHDSWK